MIVESDRLVADWLADATTGVNACLLALPLDGSDARPVPFASITDETRDGPTARGEFPTARPALAVSIDVIQELDGTVVTVTRDGHLKIRLRVAVDNPDTAAAMTAMGYYLRAALRSLRKLFEVDESLRVRNQIYLETCITLALQTYPPPAESGTVTGAILATLQLRDLAP